MKTAIQIQMDFSRTMQRADELESLSRQLDSLATQQMEETLQGIARSWIGEASSQYQDKGRELERKIKAASGQMRNTAETIRTTARLIYNAEQEALRLAEIRDR